MKPRTEIKKYLYLKRALQFAWKAAPFWTIINSFITIVQGILPLAIIFLMKLIVDSVTEGALANDKESAFYNVLYFVIFAGIIFFINSALKSVSALIREHQSQIVSDYMYSIIHKKTSQLDLQYFENSNYYDILHRARIEAPFRPNSIVNNLVYILQNIISLMLIFGLIMTLHWVVSILLLVATLPGILIRLKFAKEIYDWKRSETPTERKTDYYNGLLTSLRFAKEVRLFGLSGIFIERFKNLKKLLREEKFKIVKKQTLISLVSETTTALTVFGSYAYISYKAIRGEITLGDLVMYFLAFQKGFDFLRSLFSGIAGLFEDNLFLNNLFEFLNLPQQIVSPKHSTPFPSKICKGISIRNLDFKYPNGNKFVLKNINIQIKVNETIAIVGENGVGKTTLIKLLCKFYKPTKGEILFDEVNIEEMNTEEIRENISVIFQDYAHYHLSAKENIAFGNIAENHDDNKIRKAAKTANIDLKLENLPKKYESVLGKLFENGEELSIGEYQKVALARAFYKNSQIIVLDEPTSSIDPRSEYEIIQNFENATKNKTAIIISHRLSSVKMADKIYVLDKENLIESGTHEELMHLKGKYADLYNIQSEKYRT